MLFFLTMYVFSYFSSNCFRDLKRNSVSILNTAVNTSNRRCLEISPIPSNSPVAIGVCCYLCHLHSVTSSSHGVALWLHLLIFSWMLVSVYVQMPQGVIILISAGRSVWAGVCIQTSDHFPGFHQLLISTGFSYISSALHTDSSVQGCVGGLGLPGLCYACS